MIKANLPAVILTCCEKQIRRQEKMTLRWEPERAKGINYQLLQKKIKVK